MSETKAAPARLGDEIVSRINQLGWSARTPLAQGLAETYRWYLEHASEHRRAVA